MAAIIELIYVEYPRGKGTKSDPCRMIEQYFKKDGTLVFEIDHWANDKKAKIENEEG